MVATGEADIFLTYCTNAALAQRENPSLRVIDSMPDALAVGADYGIAVLNGAPAAADAVRAIRSRRPTASASSRRTGSRRP